MYTRKTLMAALRKSLKRARIEYHDLPHAIHANSEWEDSPRAPILIKIDKSAAGDTPCTIHELLHVELDERLRAIFDDELNEVVIAAVEAHLVGKLAPVSLSWWRKAIHRRIK